MTSFLALRASVCVYLWCLIPSVCYIGFELESSFTISAYLAGSLLARREVPSSKPDRPLYFLFTPDRRVGWRFNTLLIDCEGCITDVLTGTVL